MAYNQKKEEEKFKNYIEFHNYKVYENTFEMLELNFCNEDIKILKSFLNKQISFKDLTPQAEKAYTFMRIELDKLL